MIPVSLLLISKCPNIEKNSQLLYCFPLINYFLSTDNPYIERIRLTSAFPFRLSYIENSSSDISFVTYNDDMNFKKQFKNQLKGEIWELDWFLPCFREFFTSETYVFSVVQSFPMFLSIFLILALYHKVVLFTQVLLLRYSYLLWL